jgi:hypothetical protein
MAMIERCNLMLEADKDAGAPWGDESMIGSFNEVIIGGAIALHFKAARSTIPSIVNLDQVEAIPFLAMLSLGGEYDGAMWWVRADVISACRSADADQFNKYKLMKMSWARVDKEKLHTVLFAPRFPGTVGAAADWDALKAHAVELHNAGRAPGLIACGARAAWLNEPVMLYPTLAAIRGANYLTLMSDKEIRSVVTEMEIDAKEFDAADDDDEPEDDENGEDEVEELVVAEAELGDCTRQDCARVCCLQACTAHTLLHMHRLSALVTRFCSLGGAGPATAGAAVYCTNSTPACTCTRTSSYTCTCTPATLTLTHALCLSS